MSKRIYVRDLKEGYKLEEDIKYQEKVLLKKGTVLTENKVSLIRKWFKNLDTCVNISSSASLEKETIDAIHKLYEGKLSSEAFNQVKDCMKEFVVDVKLLEEIYCDMQCFTDEYEEAKEKHLFRVARLAIALANVYNNTAFEKINLADIGMAAVLHDYGKNFEGRRKEIKKLKADKNLFKKLNLPSHFLKMSYLEEWHAVYAYLELNLIFTEGKIPKIVLLSGIHDNIMNAKFSDESAAVKAAAKIVTLCYVYDELLEVVVKENVETPLENVLAIIEQGVENGNLSQAAYNLFRKNVQMYVPGTKVLLTTGEEATVVKNNRHFLTKPMVYTDNALGSRRFVDLSVETKVTIKRILQTKVYDIQSNQLNRIIKQE